MGVVEEGWCIGEPRTVIVVVRTGQLETLIVVKSYGFCWVYP